MTRPPSRRAPALPPEERREALIAATLPLVLEYGTDVTTRLIAEAAGVAEGTIFRVFPSKRDLMEAVLASAFDASTVVTAIGRLDRTAPLEDRLVAAVELMQARGRRILGLLHAFAARGTLPPHREHDPDRGMRVRASEARVVDALALLIEPDRKQLRCTPQETARRLRLITLALSSSRLSDADPLPAEEIVSLLFDGLRRRDATSAEPGLATEVPAC